MATKKSKGRRARKRAPRRISSEGYQYSFHGAFKSKAKAQAKARRIGGFTVGRLIAHGDYRHIVMGPASGVGF